MLVAPILCRNYAYVRPCYHANSYVGYNCFTPTPTNSQPCLGTESHRMSFCLKPNAEGGGEGTVAHV